MNISFFQGVAILKKSKMLKIVSSLLFFILIIVAFPAPAHATAVPINVELNQFTSANVAGDGGTSLLWKKADANTTSSGVLRIVPNIGNQHGVVVRRNKIKLTGGFSTNFVMNMNGSNSSLPADGLTFVIQSNAQPLVGNWGAGLGYQSVGKSLGVEFDIWKNVGQDVATSTGQYYYDPNANHVAIVKNGDNMHTPANMDAIDDGTLTTGTVVTNGAGTKLTSSNPGTPLSLYKSDGTLDVNVWIDYDGTTLTATYGPSSTKTSSSNRVISKNVGNDLNNQDVYVGFSGSTGGSNANIDIKKWSFTDTYDPDPDVPPIQGANSVGITLIPGSINPTTANFRVKDINNNDMLNQDVAVYLDDSTTPISTINTGTNGAQATYSIGTLSAGSHTIKGVAANGGASNFASFSVIIPITAIGAISGSPQVGAVLTAGALTPVGATASYQWQIASTANGSYSNITGATGTTYIPVAGDLAKFIKVVATGIGNYSGTVTSAPTQAVAAPPTLYVSPAAATIPFGSTQQFEALFTNGTPNAFNYAIFSGSSSDLLGVYGSNLTINGDIHTNNAFQSSSSIFNMTGTCEAVKTVNVWGSIINMKKPVENAAYIDMPDFSETIKTQANAAGQLYVGNKNYSGTNIDLSSPIYVNGDLTISGSQISGKGTIVATGDITISGSGISLANGASVCIYSKTGNITVSSSVATLNGIFYAPKGRIGVYASNETINGRLVGNTVQLSCSTLNITNSANDLSSVPSSGPISVTSVWSSSNPSVASISSDGVATGNGLGTCTITAKYIFNNVTYQASAQLTIVASTAISPTMATFDKNCNNVSVGHYADVATTMTLYGATLSSIKNGNVILTSDTDYTISGSAVTIKKAYLAAQSIGTASLTFSFSDGSTKTLTVTVSDSTPPTISPTTAKFDKNSANINPGHYADVATTMTLNAATLNSIKNGSVTLTANDYTISGSTVTILKAYLAKQSIGTTSLTFSFSDGSTQTLTITVSDSTSPTISPTAATFDKNSASTNYTDVATIMTLNTATLSSIMNGSVALTAGSDYTISGSTVTILKAYLATQSVGTTSLTFTFSEGSTKTLTVTVSDSTPPTISPATATFDKNSASTNCANVTTTMTLYSASLSSIKNGSVTLTEGSGYTISGNTVTIPKVYLAAQSVGTTSLTFTFSDGSTKLLTVTVSDSTPTISPIAATFDKNSANTSTGHYADIPVTMTLNGSSLTSITNGSTTLKAGSDYTVSGSNITLSTTYLSTLSTSEIPTSLTFTFSSGNTQVLGITVSDSTPTISPTTATFDKNSANTSTGHYADIPVTMTLNGNTLTSITNGGIALKEGSAYTVSGSDVTLSTTYLVTLPTSETPTNLTFTFSSGNTQGLEIMVIDGAPTIDPTTATFDKNINNTNVGHYVDLPVTMTLNGSNFISIANGSTPLTEGSDYTKSEVTNGTQTVTLSKTYLLTLPTSSTATSLTFQFNGENSANTQTLNITVGNTKLISDLSIATQTGAHRISILPNVPIQAIIGLKLSRPATYLTMDFSKSNLNVGLPNHYCDNLDSGQKISFSIDSTNPKIIILHPTEPNTTFPGGTYRFGAYITEDGTSLIMESTATAQDAADSTFIDSTDAESSLSLNINVGTAPPLH